MAFDDIAVRFIGMLEFYIADAIGVSFMVDIFKHVMAYRVAPGLKYITALNMPPPQRKIIGTLSFSQVIAFASSLKAHGLHLLSAREAIVSALHFKIKRG